MTSSQRCSSQVDLLGQHAQALAAAGVGALRDAEVGAEVEEVVLDVAQPRRVGLGEPVDGERDADLRVQLVDGAVGLDARIGLRDAAHVAEVGLAVVAQAGVDAGEVDGHGSDGSTRRPCHARGMLGAFKVGGEGKSGEIPARTRHCDRAT